MNWTILATTRVHFSICTSLLIGMDYIENGYDKSIVFLFGPFSVEIKITEGY